jgi:hypothetical protein
MGKIRPMPEGFAEVAKVSTRAELRRTFHCNDKCATRWLAACGVKPRRYRFGSFCLPAPADLADNALTMTGRELARHYNRDTKTVFRWLREAGIRPAPFNYSACSKRQWQDNPPRQRRPKSIGIRVPKPKITLVSKMPRDTTLSGQAADHLRKWAAVYRCDPDGRPNQSGSCWHYGMLVLSTDQLMERARNKGWNPSEWEMLAA